MSQSTHPQHSSRVHAVATGTRTSVARKHARTQKEVPQSMDVRLCVRACVCVILLICVWLWGGTRVRFGVNARKSATGTPGVTRGYIVAA